MGKTAIFYGSTEGNTENVAYKLKDLLGGVDVYNVDSASADDLQKYDNLIFGASTWEIGELQEDWETFIDVLDDVDFAGKTVAFFGTGDADGYPDTFVDALGIIYERIKDSGQNSSARLIPRNILLMTQEHSLMENSLDYPLTKTMNPI
jgi:flavodoxin I